MEFQKKKIHGVWVLEFRETPRNQGYKSKAKVKFLVDEAPHDILKPGFKFAFFDGSKEIGSCEIINTNSIKIADIQTRLDLIEDEKIDFKRYINSLKSEEIIFIDSELKKMIKYSNDYPYIFSFILGLNKEIALEYLKEYFFTTPIENNIVFHSNLPLFLFSVKKNIGDEELKKMINGLPDEVKSNEIIVNAMNEIS